MTNVYEMVTARIIEQLKQGIIPWYKPWTGTAGAWSRTTGKPYSLLNQILLGSDGEYATFKQISEEGGKVKKGEKAHYVVFWKMIKPKDVDETDEEETLIPILRYYKVFNINQCEGIEQKYNKEDVALDFMPIERCEKILHDYLDRENISLCHIRSDRAYYMPAADSIHLPLAEQFTSVEEYYSTAFHEAAHSTGHSSRLGRLDPYVYFGDEGYSKEELVAELTSSAILHSTGIETPNTFKNSAAYIQSWISALKDDVRMIVSASSKADKAYNMIMGIEA